MRVIIAAAGTGGHINPGIAIANKIKEKQPNSDIIFIGTNRGLENDLVPRAGYKLRKIEAYGLSSKININNLKNIYRTWKSKADVKEIIQSFKPDVVIGTGGYICGPVITAAISQKVPTILHESNAFPGKSVRFLSSKVDKVLVSFEDAKKRLMSAKKIVLTGTPTKIRKKEVNKKEILKNLGLDETLPTVLVFGGSQGASSINEAIIHMILNHMNEKYQLVWATGPKQFDSIKLTLEANKMSMKHVYHAEVSPYIYNMEEMMNVADLIVCRSGAMTITEISIVEKPAIFIPFPYAAENHQEYNARVLEKLGAAKIILNKNLTAESLHQTIEEMIRDRDKMKMMGQLGKKVAIENVEDRIYHEIMDVIHN